MLPGLASRTGPNRRRVVLAMVTSWLAISGELGPLTVCRDLRAAQNKVVVGFFCFSPSSASCLCISPSSLSCEAAMAGVRLAQLKSGSLASGSGLVTLGFAPAYVPVVRGLQHRRSHLRPPSAPEDCMDLEFVKVWASWLLLTVSSGRRRPHLKQKTSINRSQEQEYILSSGIFFLVSNTVTTSMKTEGAN